MINPLPRGGQVDAYRSSSSSWASTSEDLKPFAFAGVWEFARLGGEDILSTAMIVGEANPLVGGVHDRMPVMLMSEDYVRWLGPATSTDDLKAMLKPYDPVNRAVNSVKVRMQAASASPTSLVGS